MLRRVAVQAVVVPFSVMDWLNVFNKQNSLRQNKSEHTNIHAKSTHGV